MNETNLSPEEQTNPNTQEPGLHYTLDGFGVNTLDKLAKWSRFVGIFNIFSGIPMSLTLLILNPFFFIGVIMIILGVRLVKASTELRLSLLNKNSQNFLLAVDHLRSYIVLTGVLYIIFLVFFFLILIGLVLFGLSVTDFFYGSSEFSAATLFL